MKITSIKIEKLFEIFDYDISFENNENLLIITGPNGFGKTMILNIIFNLFNKNFFFFEKLVFRTITISLSNLVSINILKEMRNDKSFVQFVFSKNDELIGSFNSNEFKINGTRTIGLPLGRASNFIDSNTKEHFPSNEIVYEYSDATAQEMSNDLLRTKPNDISQILQTLNVQLIKEQRLFKRVGYEDDDGKDTQLQLETIQTYAISLTKLINQQTIEFLKLSQELDNSYPQRLISENGRITKDDYYSRFRLLLEKQNQLSRNGLYEHTLYNNIQKPIDYSEPDSKALLVYLKDSETKLKTFDNLLEKIEMFVSILNERRFTFKSIYIDKDKGFYFKTTKGKNLELYQLSTGEQHEIILLYELIFNAKENTLVLIDEPELSLHVTWQKEFISDLMKIIELQNIQVMVATHAPAIINGRWDLVYGLEKVEAR